MLLVMPPAGLADKIYATHMFAVRTRYRSACFQFWLLLIFKSCAFMSLQHAHCYATWHPTPIRQLGLSGVKQVFTWHMQYDFGRRLRLLCLNVDD